MGLVQGAVYQGHLWRGSGSRRGRKETWYARAFPETGQILHPRHARKLCTSSALCRSWSRKLMQVVQSRTYHLRQYLCDSLSWPLPRPLCSCGLGAINLECSAAAKWVAKCVSLPVHVFLALVFARTSCMPLWVKPFWPSACKAPRLPLRSRPRNPQPGSLEFSLRSSCYRLPMQRTCRVTSGAISCSLVRL